MDVKDFCDSTGSDLIGWKAKLYDVIRKTENLDKENKGQIAPMVKELNQLMDDLDNRINILADECPLEWEDQKVEIQEKLSLVVPSQWMDQVKFSSFKMALMDTMNSIPMALPEHTS